MNSQWNTELIYKMIDLYRERPLLWDNSLDEYKDRDRKNAAWIEIAECLDIERDTVERKMRILVSQFRREIMKLKSSCGENSKWFAFKQMLFLKEKWADSGKLNTSGDDLKLRNNTVVEYVMADPISTSPAPTKRRHQGDKSEECSNKTKKSDDNTVRDEFTIFGEYVATKLRNLDNSYASNTAQYHINNILYNADIGKYNKNERESRRNSQENYKYEQYEEVDEFEEIEVP